MWNSLWYSTTESKDAINNGAIDGQVIAKAKVVIVGDSCVGKSALLTRLKKGGYLENFITTMGEDLHTQLFDIANHSHSGNICVSTSCSGSRLASQRIQLNIHDTGGQDRALDLIPLFYRGANAFIIVYDVTSIESFAAVKLWADRITKHAGITGCADPVKLLVGNKCDSLSRVVSEDEGRKMADSIDAGFIETSAKQNLNVQDIFTSVSDYLVERIITDIKNNASGNSSTNGVSDQIALQLPTSMTSSVPTSGNFPIFATQYAQCQSLPTAVSGWCW